MNQAYTPHRMGLFCTAMLINGVFLCLPTRDLPSAKWIALMVINLLNYLVWRELIFKRSRVRVDARTVSGPNFWFRETHIERSEILPPDETLRGKSSFWFQYLKITSRSGETIYLHIPLLGLGKTIQLLKDLGFRPNTERLRRAHWMMKGYALLLLTVAAVFTYYHDYETLLAVSLFFPLSIAHRLGFFIISLALILSFLFL